MQLSEDILHFVWRHGLFSLDDLKTTNGLPLQLINRGIHNHHSGPDFMEAKVKIGETIWAGQIEMHVKASDWYLHHHEKDNAYDNVILHVVYFDDKEVFVSNQKIPTLVLNGRIPPTLFSKYKLLLQKENSIACSVGIKEVKRTIVISQLERSLTDRLERKSEKILEIFQSCNNDWEETIFRTICLQMAGKINMQAMEWLVNEVKLKQLRASGQDLFQKEAFLFGVAGMLNDPSDDYTIKLKNEFIHLQTKYHLTELNSVIWRFGRMRPAQFPSLRIAQIAAIISRNEFLFEFLLKENVEAIIDNFFNIQPSEYWNNHHQLGKSIKYRSSKMGQMQKELMLINVVAPFIFAYGKYLSEDKWKEKAMDLLFKIKPEKNHILRKWEKVAIKAESAFDSQALIELYNNFCIQKKCITCHIGTSILKS
jgi:hypothetical protein